MQAQKKYYLNIQDITALDEYQVIISNGMIEELLDDYVLKISFLRKDIESADLRKNISLDALHGKKIAFFANDIHLDLNGIVLRSEHKGKGLYYAYVQLDSSFPHYFLENLKEMLEDS